MQGTEAGRWGGPRPRPPRGVPPGRAQGSAEQLLAEGVQLAAGHPAVPGYGGQGSLGSGGGTRHAAGCWVWEGARSGVGICGGTARTEAAGAAPPGQRALPRAASSPVSMATSQTLLLWGRGAGKGFWRLGEVWMAALAQAFLGMGSVSEHGWAWGQLRREAQRAAGSGGALGGGEARGVLGPGAGAGGGLPSTRSLKRTCCVRLRRRCRRLSMSGESRLSSTERTVMAFSWPPSPEGRASRLSMAHSPAAAAPALCPSPELPGAAGGLIPRRRAEGMPRRRRARGCRACCPPPAPTAPGTRAPRAPCPASCLPAGSPWSRRRPLCSELSALSSAELQMPSGPVHGSRLPDLQGQREVGDPALRSLFPQTGMSPAAPRSSRPPCALPPSIPRGHHQMQRDKL